MAQKALSKQCLDFEDNGAYSGHFRANLEFFAMFGGE